MTRSPVSPNALLLHFTLLGWGWLSSLSLLGGGAVMAQAPSREVLPTVTTEPLSTVASEPTPAMPAVPLLPELPESQFAAPAVKTPIGPAVNLTRPTPASTDFDAGPGLIVLKQRSSGCQTTLVTGQSVPDRLCAAAEVPPRRTDYPLSRATVDRGRSVGAFINSISDRATGTPLLSSLVNSYNRRIRALIRLDNGNRQLLFPLSIPAPISSMFGWRRHPITGDYRFHAGTDLAAPLGTPVLAAYAGRVVLADWLGGYGLAVALDHDKGTQQTLYAHLSQLFVRPGDVIKQGEVIGRVGSTGNSTGPHLHFEVRQLTPDGWVARDAGEQLEYALAQLVRALQVAQAKAERG